ncbi:MAG: hypothetical protein AAFV87_10925 [Pseudomonadota bacterium]
MGRHAIIWAALVGLSLIFLTWHAPWKPALTPAEWRQMVQERGGSASDMPPEFVAFFDSDDGKPFYMLNIIDRAVNANYPDGFETQITEADDARRAYGVGVLPELLKRGSYPVFSATQMTTVIASIPAETNRFEWVVIARYRSRRDLLEMSLSDGFRAAAVHKWASLDGTIVMPTARSLYLDLSLTVPLALFALGIAVTRRRNQRGS